MYCASCGTQNLPTDLRCLRCGASLVGDTVGGSEKFRKTTREMDMRMYGGAAGFLGFVLTVLMFKTVLSDMYLNDMQVYGSAFFASLVFRALGRYIARDML
jgi:uncharacterized membrane protein YvbJ